MATLNILLADGFQNDDVVIRINGSEVARKFTATTDLRTSSAGFVDVPAPDATCTLTVEVPKQRVLGSIQLDANATPFVAVSIQGHSIDFHTSPTRIPVF